MMTRVSIIVCTFDRPESVCSLIDSIDAGRIPVDLPTEVIVVDNSPDGRNLGVLDRMRTERIVLRYVSEPRQGKCTALNTALGQARGDIILLTDDDCRTPSDWIEEMCRPIADGRADVVGGGVVIAPQLRRTWMNEIHRVVLLDGMGRIEPAWRMIGANAAFSRGVLDRVPAFDSELGPAEAGAGEDSLFFAQLREAGFRGMYAGDSATVVHHFEPRRLSRVGFRGAVEKLGRSRAYIDYHWEHQTTRWPRLRAFRALLGLWVVRFTHRRSFCGTEGIGPFEFHQLSNIHYFRHVLIQQRRDRNYARRGLRKLKGIGVPPASDGRQDQRMHV